MKAVQNLLHSMEDIEHVLMNHADSSAGLDRAKMQTLLSLASGRNVPESEVDLIFKVFDSKNDGKLSFSKYLAAINRPPEVRHGWRN
jgi:Ca2+-binding EF-hand superfamily protein